MSSTRQNLSKFIFLFFILFSFKAQSSDAIGVVYSDKSLTLSSGVSGLVDDVLVTVGTPVKRLERLVALERKIQQLEVDRRYVILKDNSEVEAIRQKQEIISGKLKVAEHLYHNSKSISKDELDELLIESINLKGRFDQLKAQKEREKVEYQLSKAELSQREIFAPVDGIITKVHLKEGEWVRSGDPLIEMVNIDEVYIKLNVSDAVARKLAVGRKVSVDIENIKPVLGKLTFIAPIADSASGLVEMKVLVKNKNHLIRPGIKASVKFMDGPGIEL